MMLPVKAAHSWLRACTVLPANQGRTLHPAHKRCAAREKAQAGIRCPVTARLGASLNASQPGARAEVKQFKQHTYAVMVVGIIATLDVCRSLRHNLLVPAQAAEHFEMEKGAGMPLLNYYIRRLLVRYTGACVVLRCRGRVCSTLLTVPPHVNLAIYLTASAYLAQSHHPLLTRYWHCWKAWRPLARPLSLIT